MVAAERAESLDVLVAGFAAGLAGDVIERALGVDRVVEHDRVDDQAERAELFFLALVVGAGGARRGGRGRRRGRGRGGLRRG